MCMPSGSSRARCPTNSLLSVKHEPHTALGFHWKYSPTIPKKTQEVRYGVLTTTPINYKGGNLWGLPVPQSKSFFLGPNLSHSEFWCRRETISTIFKIYNYFPQSFFKMNTFTCCYFSWSTKRVLGWKCDLLRLGSVMEIAELCCSYEFYFNFSVNSSPFCFALLIRHQSIRGNITLQLEKQFHFQKLEHLG